MRFNPIFLLFSIIFNSIIFFPIHCLGAKEISGYLLSVDSNQKTAIICLNYDRRETVSYYILTIHWNEQTLFRQFSVEQDFKNFPRAGQAVVIFGLSEKQLATVGKGSFSGSRVSVLPDNKQIHTKSSGTPGTIDGFFIPDSKNDFTTGFLLKDGQKIRFTLDPSPQIYYSSPADAKQLIPFFSALTVWGELRDNIFWADKVNVTHLPDPRKNDSPNLPSVLVIGDSISKGYIPFLKKSLKDIANIHDIIDENAASTQKGKHFVDLYLGPYWKEGYNWNLIIFNFGLHDIIRSKDSKLGGYSEKRRVPKELYQQFLDSIIRKLQKTRARLVWVTTTPVPAGGDGKDEGRRVPGDEKKI